MAQRTVPDALTGLILHDPSFGAAVRSATYSTATQGEPAPGLTTNTDLSAMELVQEGEAWAGETLTITTLHGGDATAGPTAARVLWHGESALSGTTDRGWLPFNVPSDWHALNTVATRDSGTYPGIGSPTRPHALRLRNGDVLVAFEHTNGGTDYIGVVRYDAETGGYDPSMGRYDAGIPGYVWSAQDAYTWTADAVSDADAALNSSNPLHPCLVELPSGKLLLFFVSSQSLRGGSTYWTLGLAVSEDAGATWTLASADTGARLISTTGTPLSLQVVYHAGYLTAVLAHDDGGAGGSFVHFYSVNEGSSWTEITDADSGTTEYWSPQLVACDDGTVVAFWIQMVPATVVGDIYASRKLIPSQPLKASGVAVSPSAAAADKYARGANRLAACMGPERTIHLLGVVADSVATSERLRYARFPQSLAAATDAIHLPPPGDGIEGEPLDYADGVAGAQHPYARTCCIWGERLALFWDPVAGSTLFQLFGGHSSIDWNGPSFGIQNPSATRTRFGLWWDATYTPSTVAAWTVAGAGAEGSSVEQALSYDFSGGASTRTNSRTGTAGSGAVAWVRHRQDSGGSLTTDDSIVRLRSADGVFDYDITVRLTTTSIRMVDNNNAGATVGTDATGLTASDTRDLLISLTSTGRAVCWYKAATSQLWTQGPTGNVTNDGATPAATPLILWGHSAASTQKSTWFYVGSSIDQYGAWPASVTEPNQDQLVFGREISLYPGYLADGRLLRAASMPAIKPDAWSAAASFAYPLDALDPEISPSPAVSWRSASDTVEQILAWEFSGNYQSLSPALGLYVRAPNFLQVTWERWNGAAWVAVATVSTVALSGAFTRSGYLLTPNAAVGSIAVSRNELAGAWVVLTNGGNNYYRRLAANMPGVWSNGTDDLQAILQLEGDLTGLPTTGTLQVIAPEVAHVLNAGGIASTRWRLRFPARTYSSASESYHTASVVLLGPYLPLGRRNAWGRTMGAEPIQTIGTLVNGRRRVRQLAPRFRRSVELPFTDPILAWDIYYQTISSGVAGTIALEASGNPAAFAQDPRQIEDLLLAAQGAKLPVVYLPRLVPPSGTIVQRDLLLYGRIVNPTLRTSLLGEEGAQESQTISNLRIEEEL